MKALAKLFHLSINLALDVKMARKYERKLSWGLRSEAVH